MEKTVPTPATEVASSAPTPSSVPNSYEPPAIESATNSEDLEREVFYAGIIGPSAVQAN